jgi:hypothetical protein
MWAALAAVLAHPSWWTIALAGFLVRGGIILVALPILTLPTTAGLTTALAPTLEAIYLGRPTLEGAVIAIAVIFAVLGGLTLAGLTGAWLDLALVREAAGDDDVDLGWTPRSTSVVQALAIRLTAHIPTTIAIAYGLVRLVTVAYDELTAPTTADDPVAVRVLVRAPDAVLVVLLAWLVGEAIGALAARRAWSGASAPRALLAAVAQLLGRRGLATLGLTSAVVAGAWLVFVLAAERAWEHLRALLLEGAPPDQLVAAVVLLATTWGLGLAVLGAGLAWRATAWTSEVRAD